MAYDPRGILVYWRSGSLFAQGFDPKKLTVEADPVLVAEKVEYTQNERGVFSISSEGTLVYHIGAGMGQLAKLEWYGRDGEPQGESAPYDSYLQLSLDPDGRRVAYTDGLTVWSRDLVRGTATRVTHDDRDYFTPVWSPDGMWLAYATNRIGGGEIRKMRASGLGDEELVATLDHQAELRSWSPDGRFLAYEALSPGTEWDCWIYSFDEGESRRIVGSKYTDGDPVFSPDGRWIAFWSNESGRTEIYVVPVDDLGRKWQVSTDGGQFPVWDPTGTEIYFSDYENRLMAVSVELQGDVKIGTPRMLFPMPEQPVPSGAFDFAEFAVSPDGKRFLLHHAQDQERISESLVLVQSWPEITRGGSE